MVVCKFFLQGRCKFGDNCKFEHQIDDSTHNHSASVMRQLQQPSGSIDTNTLVRSVQNDMLNAEKGGQWFLSSYAPFKDKPAFPGFEDKSFEEVRFGFYEASKAGTAEQYVQQLQTIIKDAVLKSKALQNPSPETVHLLTQIYNSQYNTPGGNFSSFQTFPDMSSSNTPLQGSSNFNSNALGKSIFSQNNQGMFGQSPMFVKQNMYSGVTQSSSIFNAPPQNSPAIFGGGQKSIFGGGSQSYSGGIFGQQNNIPAQNPIFAPQQNPAQINPFKNQVNNPFIQLGQVGNSPFVKQNDAPLFGVHNQPTSNSPLVGNFVAPLLPSSVFNTTSQALPFNTQNETNPHFTFNVQQPPESIRTQEFDSSRQRDSVFPPSPLGLLGGAQEDKQLGSNIFGARNPSSLSVVNIDESVYSKVENLNESDVKAFQSERFEFGEIPEKPPTLQMCF